jgi:hypothetical protein
MKKVISGLLLIIILFIVIAPALEAQEEPAAVPKKVKIMGSKGRWQMTVDGQPYYIQGVGCGDYLHEEIIDERLASCKALGANTIRRWGKCDYDDLILDKAGDYGLMVMMGFWLPIELDYVNDDLGKEALLENILYYVKEYKNNPNILLWGIGNETIVLAELDMKRNEIEISKEDKEARRVAFAKFLEEVCKRVHEEDPNHPVAYAGAGFTALEYIKKYTPSLDIYGVNFYGGATIAYDAWSNANVNLPYIFTEFGPLGPWEVRRDENELPVEPTEEEKADSFKNVWLDCIKANRGYNLGGFAFHLNNKVTGIEGMSPTWWGLEYEGYKKRSYWMVRYMYTGQKPENYPPIINDFVLNKREGLIPGDILKIKASVTDNEKDALKAKIEFYHVDHNEFIEKISIDNISAGIAEVTVPNLAGIYRVYLFVRDDKGNITCANRSISVGE